MILDTPFVRVEEVAYHADVYSSPPLHFAAMMRNEKVAKKESNFLSLSLAMPPGLANLLVKTPVQVSGWACQHH